MNPLFSLLFFSLLATPPLDAGAQIEKEKEQLKNNKKIKVKKKANLK